jgi:hypothetical protein
MGTAIAASIALSKKQLAASTTLNFGSNVFATILATQLALGIKKLDKRK